MKAIVTTVDNEVIEHPDCRAVKDGDATLLIIDNEKQGDHDQVLIAAVKTMYASGFWAWVDHEWEDAGA